MAQGFLAFALSAVFLLALLASGNLISELSHGGSYQKYRAIQIEDLAIKRAIYSSVSESASVALSSSEAAHAEPYPAVKQSVLLALMDFERQAQGQGYNAALWCVEISDEQNRQASALMAQRKAALLPGGALPISDARCLQAFEVSILERKIHFSYLGFSAYFPLLGTGISSILPAGYEVDF